MDESSFEMSHHAESFDISPEERGALARESTEDGTLATNVQWHEHCVANRRKEHLSISILSVENAAMVPAEHQSESPGVGKDCGTKETAKGRRRRRSCSTPVPGTTPTQRAYREHTRDLLRKLDRLLPTLPSAGETLGDKLKKASKPSRPKNVLFEILLDHIEKLRRDDEALEMAEHFMNHSVCNDSESSLLMQAKGENTMGSPHYGVPVEEMYGEDLDQHNPPEQQSFYFGHEVCTEHVQCFSRPAGHTDVMNAQSIHVPVSSHLSSSHPGQLGPAHATYEHKPVLGGGQPDKEILDWLLEGSDFKVTAHEKGVEQKDAVAVQEWIRGSQYARAPPSETDFRSLVCVVEPVPASQFSMGAQHAFSGPGMQPPASGML